jgi:DNA invertase Pin-like site-specific DNA recombinase
MRPRVVPESGEPKSFRVALYARVSTVHGGQNPEMQLWEMREYCERRNWIIAGEYMDRASGLRDSRPSLNLLFKDATQRKFDSVLVWKLDRFGRSLRHLVNCLAELQALGRVAHASLRISRHD